MVGFPLGENPRVHHLVTAYIPLESEFSRKYGEWSGNDPSAHLPE